MSKTIRWGLIGTGWVAGEIAQSFSLVPEAKLIAVGSRTADRARRFAEQFDIPAAYGSYDELLQDGDIDVVYVATPHHRHRDDSLRAIAAGKGVMCEKPFTLNALQAEEIIAAARAKGLFCMEAMWMRFIPLIREMKRRVDAGELGEVLMLIADFGYPAAFDSQHRYFRLDSGGGCLLDRGVYPLSFAVHLMGVPASYCSHAAIGTTGVDEQSAYVLGYDNGAVAELSASLRTYTTNEAVIAGSRGQIRIHAPFYCPSRMRVSRFPEVVATAGKEQAFPRSLKHKLKTVLKQNPGLQRVRQVLAPVLTALGGTTISRTFPGTGYQFQLIEATQCLQRGETESRIMPLDETLAIIRIMDGLREQWGMYYPDEQ